MDVQLTEGDNGGDLQLLGNDVAIVYGVENMPYLGMFGGARWWGNELLLENTDLIFTSETEALLLEVPLNSQGRITIENAIKRDLQFLVDDVPGTTLIVQTKITDDNRIEIRVNFGGVEFFKIWNPKQKTANVRNITPVETDYLINEDETGRLLTEDGLNFLIQE